MIFRPFLLLVSLIFPSVKGLCDEKIAKCEERNPSRPVCGTDGITYATRCHLLKAMCDNRPDLIVAHRGPCLDKHPCWSEKHHSEGEPNVGAYVPKCLSDGRYAPVQCHEATGYCWCVTAQGKPIANTSERNAKPKCNRRGKFRRGSGRGSKQKKGCGRIERANFINNLIRIFNTEFNRSPNAANVSESEKDRLAVRWRFESLDADGNKTLSKDEYKDLRKLVRKVVKPKKCARSFTRFCDGNKDGFITQEEWENCLQKQTIKRNKGKKNNNSDGDMGGLQESVSLLNSHIPVRGHEDHSDRKDEPEVNDCLTDRKSVLEEQADGMPTMYIPECTPDGRYRKIQCYTSAGYCWCVHEDTGKPIPGTSTRDLNPKCDAVQPPPRPMKGCSEQRKQAFLNDLFDFLKKSMQPFEKKELPLNEEQSTSKREHVAAWHFQQLDSNKNKVLERKEWKAFRTMISPHKRLRRCGKKLPRYCDVNHDRKISMTEWYNCLSAQEETSRSVPSQRRKGPNPLESFLLDD